MYNTVPAECLSNHSTQEDKDKDNDDDDDDDDDEGVGWQSSGPIGKRGMPVMSFSSMRKPVVSNSLTVLRSIALDLKQCKVCRRRKLEYLLTMSSSGRKRCRGSCDQ